MPEQCLNDPDVDPASQQVRRKRMAQCVQRDRYESELENWKKEFEEQEESLKVRVQQLEKQNKKLLIKL